MNTSMTSSISPKIDVSKISKPLPKEEDNKLEEKKEISQSPKDSVDVQKNKTSKKDVIKSLSIPLEDKVKNIGESVNKHIKEIDKILSNKNPTLELKDKEKILNILSKSRDNGSLEKLIENLDKDGRLPSLYKDMGTLVNQGTAGGAISGVLAIFTLGASMISEAKENRAYEMKKLLQDANISPDILNKFENIDIKQ